MGSAFISFLSLFIYSPVSLTLSISPATYLLFQSDNDLFQAAKPISNHGGGKTHIYQLVASRRGADKLCARCVHMRTEYPNQEASLMKCLSRAGRPVVTVQLPPSSEVLLLLHAALISARSTCHHASMRRLCLELHE